MHIDYRAIYVSTFGSMTQRLGEHNPIAFTMIRFADCERDGLWIMRELDYALYGGDCPLLKLTISEP